MSEKKRGERKTSRKESELVLREISGRMHFFDSSPGCYVFFSFFCALLAKGG